jgi:hypothetical protein
MKQETRMNKRLLALAMFGALLSLPAYAGNTTVWNPDQGSVVLPISPPTNAGVTAGTLDNTIIGATTPVAGHFTTLDATSTFGGAGVTAKFASPPSIGGTTPAAGSFTNLTGASYLGSGAAPVPTGTGTPSIAAGSTDTAGEVTAGTSATSVVITFAVAKTNAPFCVVRSQAQVASFAYTISTTAITITQTATSGNLIDYACFQH